MGGESRSVLDDTCSRVVTHLKRTVPMAFWSVSRLDGDRQVHLWVADDGYGMSAGDAQRWSATLCRLMVAGLAPAIAPDVAAVPPYAALVAGTGLRIGSYAGVPIRDRQGSLFGTICGFDPEVRGEHLLRQGPHLHVLAALVGEAVTGVQQRRDETVEASSVDPATSAAPVTATVAETAGDQRVVDVVSRTLRSVRRVRTHTLPRPPDPTWVQDVTGPPGDLTTAVRAALRASAVRAAYQPIVRLADERVVAFEALARWTHQGREIRPDVFIPAFARAGLLPELTDHMLDLAAADLATWTAELGFPALKVGVNVPPGLFEDAEFPDRVLDRLRRHRLSPQQVVIEVTEESAFVDIAFARRTASRLREVGVMLCLDDIGSGHSTFARVRHLPVDGVKIDRAYIADVDDPTQGEESRRYLRAVLAGCREYGLPMAAEGVERAEQVARLRELGIPLAQGHYFGRPATPSEIDIRSVRT